MSEKTFGLMTAHGVGIVMKEIVRRSTNIIRARRFQFEVYNKKSLKEKQDFVTDVDREVQHICIRILQENFPSIGIVAEENNLNIKCAEPNHKIYFTVDPLDGTKAFIRRQSHGFGPMLSLVEDDEVIAACVGDAMTQELYYYRPGSDKVHRVSNYDFSEEMKIDGKKPLKDQYVLLRERPDDYSSDFSQMFKSQNDGGFFKGMEIGGGGIGISMARLWKGEIGAMVWKAGIQHPWDLCPVLGISRKMGFEFYSRNGSFTQSDYFKAKLTSDIKTDRDIMIFHKDRLEEVNQWLWSVEP